MSGSGEVLRMEKVCSLMGDFDGLKAVFKK